MFPAVRQASDRPAIPITAAKRFTGKNCNLFILFFMGRLNPVAPVHISVSAVAIAIDLRAKLHDPHSSGNGRIGKMDVKK